MSNDYQPAPMSAEQVEAAQAATDLANAEAIAEARQDAEMVEHVRQMRKHLKAQSKNQLVLLAMQLITALQESNRINKFLNKSLKEQITPATEQPTTAETETPNA